VRAAFLGVVKHLAWRAILDHHAPGAEDHAVCDIAGEPHVMGHHHHRHDLFGQLQDDRLDLGHKHGVQRRGYLIKQHQLREQRVVLKDHLASLHNQFDRLMHQRQQHAPVACLKGRGDVVPGRADVLGQYVLPVALPLPGHGGSRQRGHHNRGGGGLLKRLRRQH